MIIRSTQEEVDKYFARAEMNQSSLKVIIKDGMEVFLSKAQELMSEYKEKKSLVIGSAVDCRLTMEEAQFEKSYHVSTLEKKPSDAIMGILKQTYEDAFNKGSGVDISLRAYSSTIYHFMNQEEYSMNMYKAGRDIEQDTRLLKLYKDQNAHDYWVDLTNAEGKQVLSDYEAATVDTIVHNFKYYPHTSGLLTDSKDVDLIFQYINYVTIEGVECKFMTDLLIIRHNIKKVYPVDFKTTRRPISQFPLDIEDYRYDLQGAFYSHGVQLSLKDISKKLNKDISNYTVGNFAFAAHSTTSLTLPIIFPLTDSIINRGQSGDGKDYLGYSQGLAAYKIWQKYEFQADRVFHKGIVFIDDANIGRTINF